MTKRMRHLLIIGADTDYGREIVRGIHEFCTEHGEWCYHMEDDNSPEAVKKSRFAIRRWKANGIIAHVRTKRVESLVRNSGLPAVNVSGVYETNIPTVVSDSLAIGEMVADYMIEAGFRNFAFCARTSECYSHRRQEGFVRRLSRAGFSCSVFREQYRHPFELDWVRNDRRRDRWLLSLKKPVAIMSIYDLYANVLALACRRLGLQVPNDVAIVGVGNTGHLCRMCSPPLSSVAVNLDRIGYEAARLLNRLMRGGDPPSSPILIPPERIVVRQSSDIIAADDPGVAGALHYIREHLSEGLNVKVLTHHAPVSRRTLEMAFRSKLGRTIHEEIVRTQVQRAALLLQERDLPLSEVARECGLRDKSRLHILFKQEMGTTPMEFRKMHQRKYF